MPNRTWLLERWRRIPSAPHYDASSLGNIRSWKMHGKICSIPHIIQSSKSGKYPMVSIVANGSTKQRLVHQLVAEGFLGPKPSGLVVCHNNGITTDNRVSNLRYDSNKNNELDKMAHGTRSLGEKLPWAKLKTKNIKEIKRLRMAGNTLQSIAIKFGVHLSSIHLICKGRTWKHANQGNK